MSLFPLKPASKHIKKYYAALAQFHLHGHTTEGNTRSAFADLLKKCCSPYDWHLVEEVRFRGLGKQDLRADGMLFDQFNLRHGIWEAKDNADDLRKEIKSKSSKGYPLTNILFQSPGHAVLYQDSLVAYDGSIATPEQLVEVLELFFEHKQADIPDWKDAVSQFSLKIKELAGRIKELLAEEYQRNRNFRENFESFAELCRQSINPELDDDAIRNMLVQHLLTERIFTKIFDNSEFLKRNIIAVEIEKVISSITLKHFSRQTFLRDLDHFYRSIERAAESQKEYSEKQDFLNAVYEKFFQNFDPKQADTMGVVYTPQPIVNFMVRSVDEILQQEFGKTLSDSGVHILDPFTGTGNFITRIMQQIKRSALPHKYAEELHCNEIMLLPYYIASMNIEHAYMERLGKPNELGAYRPFEGICLVDTFDLAEGAQRSLFTTENTERVKKQRGATIRVVIANPPYRTNQKNENDSNKSRKYPMLDKRVKETYVQSSSAKLKNKYADPYIKAIRWATDRLGETGVICFVTPNAFAQKNVFDGIRIHLRSDFSAIYHLNLKGDAHKSGEPRRREAGNVFQNQTQSGIGITLFVKSSRNVDHSLKVYSVDDYLSGSAKLRVLEDLPSFASIPLQTTDTNEGWSWIASEAEEGEESEGNGYDQLIALQSNEEANGVFTKGSLGVSTNRDGVTYAFNLATLEEQVAQFTEKFSEEIDRFELKRRPKNIDAFVNDDAVKWSDTLKKHLRRSNRPTPYKENYRIALYRPFTRKHLVAQDIYVDRLGSVAEFFPFGKQNKQICLSTKGYRSPFAAIATDSAADLHVGVASDTFQCFPFYLFEADGTERRENITDWALNEFRKHYNDETITKWDIFHAVYALFQHPEYLHRYDTELKRELPRIPFPPDLHAFAAAGKRLMELHINYEQQPEYTLEQIEDPKAEFTLRVERMRLNAKDKSELRYNDFLTLRGIPLAAFDYRLGNRSALEWVIDQYRVSTDAHSGIVNDPNREDDPHYILRLIGQVITVSLETQQIIASLPSLNLGA